MSKVEELQKLYETGLVPFKKLFALSSVELKSKLKEICGDKVPSHVFDKGTVQKLTTDDEPEEITITCYDRIAITPFGIHFKPEHGISVPVVAFDKFFNSEVI